MVNMQHFDNIKQYIWRFQKSQLYPSKFPLTAFEALLFGTQAPYARTREKLSTCFSARQILQVH